MADARPGEVVDRGPYVSQIDFRPFRMRVTTDRYHSRAYAELERENMWMRTWQAAGRADEIAEPGDWMEYRLFDQSYVLVRQKDGSVKGFVNACRHRGNAFCEGKGHSARFTCPYHNWSFALDGKCLSVAKPDYEGPVEEFVGSKDELGLIEVPAECFAGFVFINPDPKAGPLSEFLGEVADQLRAYKLDEMVPVALNVRERLECNWKVVMDAFQEGYHIQGVHPELIPAMDESKERYFFYGDHSVATGPFGASNLVELGPEALVEVIRGLTATFPAVAEALPRFEQLVDEVRGPDGVPQFTPERGGRELLQEATRETWSNKGLDVSGLTDIQMADNHFHLVFPNLFMTIRAGEATVIMSAPLEDNDPNRCTWHVMNLMWLPPEQRAAMREPLNDIPEGEHFTYFLALEQDYDQMKRQQAGLRNTALKELALTRQEVRLAWFHSALDSWVYGRESK
jgi:phenylpropionate dioxygenase-like ring-hydroxylating dioxygenase large terminal subunit